jgi:hypothetical protein
MAHFYPIDKDGIGCLEPAHIFIHGDKYPFLGEQVFTLKEVETPDKDPNGKDKEESNLEFF